MSQAVPIQAPSATTTIVNNLADYEMSELADENSSDLLDAKLVHASNQVDGEPAKAIDEEDEDYDDDDDQEEPSVLQCVVEKPEEFAQTINLLRKEVATEPKLGGIPSSDATKKGEDDEFKGLNKFLGDQKVQTLVKNVAGERSNSIIEEALKQINSGKTLDDRRTAFSAGIRKLHSNLRNGDGVRNNDPRFDLAISLTGLSRQRLGFK